MVLDVLMTNKAYSDVVREAQEVVELALKAMLRYVGIEPPKVHDVGRYLVENQSRFPRNVRKYLRRLAEISTWLRKEREFSFYGDVDFIPTDEYKKPDGTRATRDAKLAVSVCKKLLGKGSRDL